MVFALFLIYLLLNSFSLLRSVDEMSSRINELEDHIADISARAGIEIPPELKIPSEKQGAVQEQKQ